MEKMEKVFGGENFNNTTPAQKEINDEFLARERENHFGITPAFRLANLASDNLSNSNRNYNNITLSFSFPVFDPKNNKFNVDGNKVRATTATKDNSEQECFEATFVQQEQTPIFPEIKNNYNYNEIDEKKMREVLPQKNELVMIDKINYVGEDGVVATRKISKSQDYEGGDEFNKFRLIEMIGQAGSYYLLHEINIDKKQSAATFKNIDIYFYPEADNLQENDELVIEVRPDGEENSAIGTIRKEDGNPIALCNFSYNRPMPTKIFQRMNNK